MAFRPVNEEQFKLARLRRILFFAAPSRGEYLKRLFDAYVLTVAVQAIEGHYIAEGRNAAPSIGSRGTAKWARLKKTTLEDRKRKGFPPGPILIRSGMLFQFVRSGLSYETEINFRRQVVSIDLRKSGQPKYLKYHESGAPKNKMRARPVLRMTVDGLERVNLAMRNVFIGHFNGNPKYPMPGGK